MGQQIGGIDALETAVNAEATPETGPTTLRPQSVSELQPPLNSGDGMEQVDDFGGLTGVKVPGTADAVPADDGGGGGQKSQADALNERWQAHNTHKAQELAQQTRDLEAGRAQLESQRQELALMPRPAQEPSRGPLTFTEELAQTHPDEVADMQPFAKTVFNKLGGVVDSRTAPLINLAQEQAARIEQLEGRLQTSNNQQFARTIQDEAAQIDAKYGPGTVKAFGGKIGAEMKAAPGLSLTKAFHLAAAPELQQLVAKQVLAQASEAQKQTQGAVLQGGRSAPSAPGSAERKPGESSRQTAERLYGGLTFGE